MSHKLISNIDQLSECVVVGSKESILIGGELVFMSNDRAMIQQIVEEDEDFVMQPPRLASRSSLLDTAKQHLYLAVSREALTLVQGYRGHVGLLADQYLAYGLSSRANIIVIGGGGGANSLLNLEIMVFTSQRLVKTLEKNAPATQAGLEVALKQVAEEYPEHAIHWCDPLGPPPLFVLGESERFSEVGSAPMRSMVKRKLFLKQQGVEEPWALLPSIALALTASIVFAGAVGYQWASLVSERAIFDSEIKGFETAYSQSAESLDLLRHRDFLMRSTPEHLARINNLDRLLPSIASIDGALIRNITFFSPQDEDRMQSVQSSSGEVIAGQAGDDFKAEVSVPQQEGFSARDQAEGFLGALNQQTGMTVRVLDHASEVVRIGDVDHQYWRYRLGGAVN